jgi:hypothetical protein
MNINLKNASDILIILAKINIIGFLFIEGHIIPAIIIIWFIYSYIYAQKADGD